MSQWKKLAEEAFPGVSVEKASSDIGPEMMAQDLLKRVEWMGSASI
jgi:hypothetical protein